MVGSDIDEATRQQKLTGKKPDLLTINDRAWFISNMSIQSLTDSISNQYSMINQMSYAYREAIQVDSNNTSGKTWNKIEWQ